MRECRILAIQCGLTLEQFAELDGRDLMLYAEAARRNEQRKMEMLAWHAANCMNPHLKKAVTPRQLLGKSSNVLGMSASDIKAKLAMETGR